MFMPMQQRRKHTQACTFNESGLCLRAWYAQASTSPSWLSCSPTSTTLLRRPITSTYICCVYQWMKPCVCEMVELIIAHHGTPIHQHTTSI